MKKYARLGLVGLLLAGGGAAAGLNAAGQRLYQLAMAPTPRDPRWDETEPRIHREGRSWAQLGMGFRTLTIQSSDGLALSARALMASSCSHRWAICVHGYADTHLGMGPYALRYHQQGWNVLLPDQRCYGRSEGRQISWGYLERLDLISWISLLIRRDPQAEIVLHGVSMGAATVLMATGGPLPRQVKCAISDSSYTSLEQELHHILTRYRRSLASGIDLPAGIALALLRRTVLRRDGYDIREVSPLRAVEHSNTPTLFIHGGHDLLVPPAMMSKLYQSATCPKSRIWIAEGEHAACLGTDPVQYWMGVRRFLRRSLS